MVFRLFHFDSLTFIFRLKMRDCEVAKAKVRRCDGEASHFCLRLFDCILQISVDYIECDAGIVLAQGLPINLRCRKYARPSCLLQMLINSSLYYTTGKQPLGQRAYYEPVLVMPNQNKILCPPTILHMHF